MHVILKVQTDNRVAETAECIIVSIKYGAAKPAVGITDQKIVDAGEGILRGVARRISAVELNAVDIHAPLHGVATPGERHVIDILKRINTARLAGNALSRARSVRNADRTHLRYVGHKVKR